VLARPNPLPASLATTQPVARRQNQKRSIEPKQRWLLATASAAALSVWAAFGLLYVKRYGAPDSLRAFLSSGPESVSIALSPAAGGAKAAAKEEEEVTVEMIAPKAEAAQVAPARAAAAPARPTPPTAEAPAAAPEPTARAAAATAPEPATRPAAPTGRARVDDKPSSVKQRPGRPRQPADKTTPKRRPIDEGF
jgi:hypothetical protein